MENIMLIIINIVAIYILVGAIFSLVFLWKGIATVDDGTRDTGLVFKLLILPGMLVFWPKFLIKWIKHK